MNLNHIETNPHLQRLDQLQSARKQYQESEWRLNFLRTIEAGPPKPLTDEEICKLFTRTQPALDWN
jgi:hypothetical protein